MTEPDDLIRQFADDVPEYIASAIVDMESGMGVASYNRDPEFDISAANAAYTDFVRANRNALDILGADTLDTTDILITTNDVYLIARELSEDYYMGMALSQEGDPRSRTPEDGANRAGASRKAAGRGGDGLMHDRATGHSHRRPGRHPGVRRRLARRPRALVL